MFQATINLNCINQCMHSGPLQFTIQLQLLHLIPFYLPSSLCLPPTLSLCPGLYLRFLLQPLSLLVFLHCFFFLATAQILDPYLMKSAETDKLLKLITANPLPHPLSYSFLTLFPFFAELSHPFSPSSSPLLAPFSLHLFHLLHPAVTHKTFFVQFLITCLFVLSPLPTLNELRYCNELVIYGGGVQDLYHLPIFQCLASPSSPIKQVGTFCTQINEHSGTR